MPLKKDKITSGGIEWAKCINPRITESFEGCRFSLPIGLASMTFEYQTCEITPGPGVDGRTFPWSIINGKSQLRHDKRGWELFEMFLLNFFSA